MYEQVSHSLLNEILDELRPEIQRQNLRHFYTRLGANFYAVHSLFSHLYGHRGDFRDHMIKLVEVLASRYIERTPELEAKDMEREQDFDWFLSPEWAGMALYADRFAGDLKGLNERLPYLQELGINLIHILPILACPQGASDGGYAVSDFRAVDSKFGTLKDLEDLSESMRARKMLLTLDVVVNHTSDEHEWAKAARAGDPKYQAYYYVFPDRDVPDMFEETMPEIFPESSPGNFTYDEEMGKWVMTVFNSYQWDLNYTNPAVFIEMVDIILYWANRGADIVRLDAVAFLWKKIGTASQNEREAHLILQLMKDCCQITAPGLLFIAEAIVAPFEITKYFGEDAIVAKECEIAYNATLMALLWEAVATKNAKLLNRGIASLPDKLDRATWLNYLRCHDDIGLGFDDVDIQRAGYDPAAHRAFLVDYFTGNYGPSPARGRPFGRNQKTGDARISGSLASLVGLESALESGDDEAISHAIRLILLLHSVILSYGGIPLLYYGDELGTLNDYSFEDDPIRRRDSRWLHRPIIDWDRAELRNQPRTVENRVFHGLQRLIAIRKTIPAFADFNNRELVDSGNDHLLVYLRRHPEKIAETVIVVANFDDHPQHLDLKALDDSTRFPMANPKDLASGEVPCHAQRVAGDPALPVLLADQRLASPTWGEACSPRSLSARRPRDLATPSLPLSNSRQHRTATGSERDQRSKEPQALRPVSTTFRTARVSKRNATILSPHYRPRSAPQPAFPHKLGSERDRTNLRCASLPSEPRLPGSAMSLPPSTPLPRASAGNPSGTVIPVRNPPSEKIPSPPHYRFSWICNRNVINPEPLPHGGHCAGMMKNGKRRHRGQGGRRNPRGRKRCNATARSRISTLRIKLSIDGRTEEGTGDELTSLFRPFLVHERIRKAGRLRQRHHRTLSEVARRARRAIRHAVGDRDGRIL